MRKQVLGGADRVVTGTACRQQGLLHIYQTKWPTGYCFQISLGT